jgi:hypothetical protein
LHDAASRTNFFEKISKKFKKRLAIWKHLCYNNIRRRVTRQTQKNMGAFPSGQWGQTVNLLLNASVVRIHQLPPKSCGNIFATAFFLCCNAKK